MKSEGFWVAGNGYTMTQMFLHLEKWWSIFLLTVFAFLVIFIWLKCPKELKLIFWIVITLVITFLYYVCIPPENVVM